MTVVSVVSDLHIEYADYQGLPGGDVLIVAGDTVSAGPLQRHKNDADSRSTRKRCARFAGNEMRKYAEVVMIPGNHEYWGSTLEDAPNLLRDFWGHHAPNVRFLNNETTVIDGVAFIGSTLWASYGANHPLDALRIGGAVKDCQQIGTRRPPHYRWETRCARPEDFYALHLEAVNFLEAELTRTLAKGLAAIVITHHAPSYLSRDSYTYGIDVDEAYYSNQHRLMEKYRHARRWFHGHSHYDTNYRVGYARVISNQRDYFGNERYAKFFEPTAADFTIEELKKAAA
jgi:predicted phosphohydrolase